MAIIHFTSKTYKTESKPFTIKGQDVRPKDCVKILGVIIDDKLKYKEHIARAASKGLEAAMEPRRLNGLSPLTAKQLFTYTVAPVVDYAWNVWMHEFKYNAATPINRVQEIVAKAIVGTFMTVATSVAEAEAHIATAQDRLWRRQSKFGRTSTPCPKPTLFAALQRRYGSSDDTTARDSTRSPICSKMSQWKASKLLIYFTWHHRRSGYGQSHRNRKRDRSVQGGSYVSP